MQFPALVWVVLGGTLLTRTAFFMVWPFLVVILQRDFSLRPAEIGSILGSTLLSSALVGFYSGNLSDRFGRKPVMLTGAAGAVFGYVLIAIGGTVTAYAAGAFLAGLSRAVLESPGKALIADCIGERGARDLAFHLRYFLINVGGAAGPLIGLAFGLSARQAGFWVAAAVYAGFWMILAWAFRGTGLRLHEHGPHASLRRAMIVMRRDHRFLLLVLAMFLSMCAYAQQDSTLIQYLTVEGGVRAVPFVTALLVTNALTIVLFQFPFLWWLRPYDLFTRNQLGLALFTAGFVAYALMPVRGLLPWVVATWVLSVGEAILFPTLQLQVDRMAPGHLRGSYFGAAGLSGLGFGLGPFVGGLLLQYAGGPAAFWVTAASILACSACYWQASRMPAIAAYVE